MPEWEVRTNYDYRFGALMIQISHNNQLSPMYRMRVSEMLTKIPAHELRECLRLAEYPPSPEPELEEMRRDLIRNTDLDGKMVLDIGGYDGWAAKLALDCGAKRAVCLDNQQYHHYGWEDKKFEGVEYRTGDLFTWGIPSDEMGCPLDQGQVDIIIFYNVLYHLKNPWTALDRLRELVKPDGEMLLCTLFRYHDGSWIYLYEPRECNPTDETVYFGPSLTALERLLKMTGWDATQEGLTGDRVVYRCKPTKDWQRKHEDS